MDWLVEVVRKAGRWERSERITASVVLTDRFEVYLLRMQPGPRPVLVAKVPRTPDSEILLEREHEFLDWMRAARKEMLDTALPESFGVHLSEGRRVWLQSAVPGTQVRPALNEALFGRVAEFLGRLYQCGPHRPLDRDALFFERTEPGTVVSSRRVEVGCRLAEELAPHVRGVPSHGDLNPTNVLSRPDHIGAVDWVWAKQAGRPLFDWFDFACHVYLSVHAGAASMPQLWGQLGGALTTPGTPFYRLTKSGSEALLRGIGLPEEMAGDLLSLYVCSRFWAMLRHRHPEAAEPVVEETLRRLPSPAH